MDEREELERLRKLKRIRELEAKESGSALPQTIQNSIAAAKARVDRGEPLGETAAWHPTSLKVPDAVGALGVTAQGSSMGGFDEAAAGVSSFVNDEPYDDSLRRIREQQEMYRRENPITATGLEVAGALPLAALPFGAAKGATSIGGRMLLGGGAGAAQGTVYGFNTGEGEKDRLAKALMGGAFGGSVGALAPAAGMGIKALTRRILEKKGANAVGGNRAAFNVVRDTVSDGTSAPAGRDAMLADGSPALAKQLDMAIQSSAPARNLATARVDSRLDRAGGRITSALDDAFGQPGVSQSRAIVPYGAKNPVGDMYKRAYDSPINYANNTGMAIDDMVVNRVPPEAIAQANKLMRASGETSRQILAEIGEDGSVTFMKKPDVMQIDYITRALNDVAETQEGKGVAGGISNLGRIYQNLSRDLRVSLKENVPAYKNALDAAADTIRSGKAKEAGLELLRDRITRDQADDILGGMGKAELRKVGEGVRQHIDDTLARVKRTLANPNIDQKQTAKAITELSSDLNRDKISKVLGADESARLFDEIDDAAKAFELRAAVADGSQTAGREALQKAADKIADQGTMNMLRSGHPVRAASNLAGDLLGGSPAATQRKQDKMYTGLAEILTAPNPAGQLAKINAANSQIPVKSEAKRLLAERLFSGGHAVTGQVAGF